MSLALPEGLKLWLPKRPGSYLIDIIPYELGERSKAFAKNYAEPGDLYYERTYYNHREIGVNQDSLVCPSKNFGGAKKCPICEFRAFKAQSPRPEDEELVKDMKPKERQLFLIYDYDMPRDGIQLWEISFHMFGKNLDTKVSNATEKNKQRYRRFADPDEGMSLRLIATEKQIGRGKPPLEFTVDTFEDRDPIPEDMLNHGYCLDDFVRELPYSEIKKIFLMTDDEDADIRSASVTKPAADTERNGDRGRGDSGRSPPRGDDRSGDRTPPRGRADDAPPRGRPAPADEPPPPRTRGRSAEPDPTPPPARGRAADAPTAPGWQVGDEAEFEYRKEWHLGKITEINRNKEIAYVDVPGDRVHTVDLDQLFEPKDPVPATRTPPPPADEPPPPRTRTVQPKDDEPPPPRTRGRAADPEPPATRGRSREPDPEPPAARSTTRKSEWDDDQETGAFKREEAAPPPRGRR